MRIARTAPQGGPKRLSNCLSEGLRNALSRRVDEGSRLRHAWHACVPEPLGSHVEPVRYVSGLLFLQVNTPAWASRLRHEKPALLELLRKNSVFRDIGDIRFRVVPIEPPTKIAAAPPKPSRLSARAATVVAQTAESIADPALRAALERLAQSGRDPQRPKRKP